MIGGRATATAAISVVALSAWLGATLLVATVVAPAAFAVLPTRTLAGALVGRVLPVLFYIGAAIGVLVSMVGRTTSPSLGRVSAGVVMVAACLAAQLIVGPRIERIRLDAGRPIDQLAAGDSRRTSFGRLHGASVLLLGVAAIAGSAALVLTLRMMPRAATSAETKQSPEL